MLQEHNAVRFVLSIKNASVRERAQATQNSEVALCPASLGFTSRHKASTAQAPWSLLLKDYDCYAGSLQLAGVSGTSRSHLSLFAP